MRAPLKKLGLGLLVTTAVLACAACDSPEKAAPTSEPTQAASAAPTQQKADATPTPTANDAAGAGGAKEAGAGTTAAGSPDAP